MTDLVTDEMVEAATVASINASLAPYGAAITTTDQLQGGVEALAEMRAALEAVAPAIAAKVLMDAANEMSIGPMSEGLRARADRIERGEPLDESDHRARHFPDGEHLWWREDCGRWHTWASMQNVNHDHDDTLTLLWWAEGEILTFCDCDESATIAFDDRHPTIETELRGES